MIKQNIENILKLNYHILCDRICENILWAYFTQCASFKHNYTWKKHTDSLLFISF